MARRAGNVPSAESRDYLTARVWLRRAVNGSQHLIEKQIRLPAVNQDIAMQLTRTMSLPKRRGAHRRADAPAPQRERNKRANISEDAALYNCSCGYVFKAPVTTSVGCPHCGTAQAW
jgi:hypothetical protein